MYSVASYSSQINHFDHTKLNHKEICFFNFSVQLSYKDSGVDINAGDDLVQRIKPLARGTHRQGAIGGLGGFGGLFRINDVIVFRPQFLIEINLIYAFIYLVDLYK